jgi:hypothetical protein
MRLSKFLSKGESAEACFALSTGWPGIAFHPGSAQYKIKIKWQILVKHAFSTKLTPRNNERRFCIEIFHK